MWDSKPANPLTNKSGNTYTYDADGMITASSGAQYVYDALEQRIAKTGGSNPAETIYFSGQAVALYNPSSGAWTDLIYAGSSMVAEVAGGSNGGGGGGYGGAGNGNGNASQSPNKMTPYPFPANAVPCSASTGANFMAPPGFSVSNIAANGATNGL